jgi:hypothetical protein
MRRDAAAYQVCRSARAPLAVEPAPRPEPCTRLEPPQTPRPRPLLSRYDVIVCHQAEERAELEARRAGGHVVRAGVKADRNPNMPLLEGEATG